MSEEINEEVKKFMATISKEWIDPLPQPVVEECEGFHIVREDLINGGSKVRASDYFVSIL